VCAILVRKNIHWEFESEFNVFNVLCALFWYVIISKENLNENFMFLMFCVRCSGKNVHMHARNSCFQCFLCAILVRNNVQGEFEWEFNVFNVLCALFWYVRISIENLNEKFMFLMFCVHCSGTSECPHACKNFMFSMFSVRCFDT
jgi:hypothetical protein